MVLVNKNILLVDDDPDIQDAMSIVLESEGYNVVIANNGIECFERLAEVKPDLIILDLLMPKMDGFAVFRELRNERWSKYLDVPILILTSVREEASRRRYELETGQELNANDYIEKPLSPEVLLTSVRKLFAKNK